MKPQKSPHERGEFRRVAEGLYQYESSGAYYARFKCQGKRVMKRLGTDRNPCTSLPEAKRLLRDLRTSFETSDVTASKKTLRAVIEDYKAVMPFGSSTRLYKANHLDLLGKMFPSHKKAAEIKQSDIIRFLSKYEHRSADTRNKVLTTCRDLFRFAISDKVIATSPAEGIKYERLKAINKRLIPSLDEFEDIVQSVRSVPTSDTREESADLIEFMGLAGLGQAECAGLTWGDINFKTERITIIRKKTATEFTIPIYPQVLPLLKRMDEQREDKNSSAKVFSVTNPKKSLESACKRLNLPDYTARAFRRMFITQALERGIDPQTIAEWQGHRDGGQLILKTYGRVSPKHQKAMAALMSSPTSK